MQGWRCRPKVPRPGMALRSRLGKARVSVWGRSLTFAARMELEWPEHLAPGPLFPGNAEPQLGVNALGLVS